MLYSFSIVIQNLTLTPPATLSKVKVLLRKKFNIDLDKRGSLRLSKPIVLLSDPDKVKLEAYAKQLYSFGLDVDVVEEKVKELEVKLKSAALLSPILNAEALIGKENISGNEISHIELKVTKPAQTVPRLELKPGATCNKMQVVEKDYFTVVRAPVRRLSQAIMRQTRSNNFNKKIVLFVLLGYSIFFLMQINDERQKRLEFEAIQKQIVEMSMAD